MPQARRSGKTFRTLLMALTRASEIDATDSEMDGVVMWAYDRRYAHDLFKRACDILMSYSMSPDILSFAHRNEIVFPNGTTLTFKSMNESRERRMSIDWRLYDEMADHYDGYEVMPTPEYNPDKPNEFL